MSITKLLSPVFKPRIKSEPTSPTWNVKIGQNIFTAKSWDYKINSGEYWSSISSTMSMEYREGQESDLCEVHSWIIHAQEREHCNLMVKEI